MLILDQDNPDSWPIMLPKQHCPLKLCDSFIEDQVLFLRKSFQLIFYSQLMGIVLFLILTSNGNLMMYIGDAEYDIDIALICLIILIFVICLCQKFRKKYDIVFVVTIGFLIGWIFTSTCCVVILKDPSTKQSQLLFLVANALYILGLMCLTYRVEWHYYLCLTYTLYTIGYSIVFVQLSTLMFPDLDMDALAFTIFCISIYGLYMLVDIIVLLRGCRCPNLMTDDHAQGALTIQFDFIIIVFVLIRVILTLGPKYRPRRFDQFDFFDRR